LIEGHPAHRDHLVQVIAAVDRQCPETCAAEAGRLVQNRLEHRRQIAGRAVDDLQHLGGARLLGQRLVTLGGARIEFSLERRNPLLQICQRVIEDRHSVASSASATAPPSARTTLCASLESRAWVGCRAALERRDRAARNVLRGRIPFRSAPRQQ
jgi:hypothetical protein